MHQIQYKAPYNAFHINNTDNIITLSIPENIKIEPHSDTVLELPVELKLSEGWDCYLTINPMIEVPPIIACSPLPFKFAYRVKLHNFTDGYMFIGEGTELFKVDFYKQSITLSNVAYDKNTNICSFGFDQLESTFVNVPPQHISFENIDEEEQVE